MTLRVLRRPPRIMGGLSAIAAQYGVGSTYISGSNPHIVLLSSRMSQEPGFECRRYHATGIFAQFRRKENDIADEIR